MDDNFSPRVKDVIAFSKEEALRLGHDRQGQGGLARGLGAVDLHHPATRQAAYAQRNVEAQGAGGEFHAWDTMAGGCKKHCPSHLFHFPFTNCVPQNELGLAKSKKTFSGKFYFSAVKKILR